MRAVVTPTFVRSAKKLHSQQKQALDAAVRGLLENPAAGEAKVGDLAGVRVLKFRVGNQLWLLAYEQTDAETLKLLALGSREFLPRPQARLT